MKGMLVVTVLAVLAVGALGGTVPGSSPRQARWFLSRADVTEVVEEEKMVTQVTPWSCVVVAPSLPPCRHVRQLDIMATPPTPIAATAAPVLPRFYADNLVEAARRRYYLEQAGSLDASYYGDMVPVPAAPQGGWVPLMAREATDPLPAAAPAAPVATAPAAAPTEAAAAAPPADASAAPAVPAVPAVPDKKREQGWAEWLGLRAYTVTSTLVRYATTKVVDPDTVVTFSVRGCQPSKLPFDLPLCVAQQQVQATPEATAPAVEVGPASPPAAAATADKPAAVEETKPAPAPAPTPAEKPAPEAAPAPAEAEPAPAASTMAPIVAADKPAEPATAAAPAEETPTANP